MAKYPDVTAGQTEACINRIGGWSDFLRFIGGEGRVIFETLPLVVEPVKEKVKKVINYLQHLTTFKLLTMGGDLRSVKEVFKAHFSSNFQSEGIVFSNVAPETEIEVEELVHKGKFTDFLGSTSAELERRRLTGSQFLSICRDHRPRLRDEGFANFFVLTRYDLWVCEDLSNVFVAYVDYSNERTLYARLYSISCATIWQGEFGHRIFSPKLTA